MDNSGADFGRSLQESSSLVYGGSDDEEEFEDNLDTISAQNSSGKLSERSPLLASSQTSRSIFAAGSSNAGSRSGTRTRPLDGSFDSEESGISSPLSVSSRGSRTVAGSMGSVSFHSSVVEGRPRRSEADLPSENPLDTLLRSRSKFGRDLLFDELEVLEEQAKRRKEEEAENEDRLQQSSVSAGSVLYLDRVMARSKRNKVRDAWETVRRRFPYYVPILLWLPRYKVRVQLLPDFIAGLTVASMVVPQGLAYALLVGVPPAYGLYACWMPMLVYAMLGSSKQLAIGPEALISTLVGLVLVEIEAEDLVLTSMVMSFLSGLILFVMGLFRFGFLDSIISHTLLAGFVNAVALNIIINQVPTLFGVSTDGVRDWEGFLHVMKNIQETNLVSLGIGGVVLVLLIAKTLASHKFPKAARVLKYVPGQLLAILLGLSLSVGFSLNKNYNLQILGEVKASFPVPRVPDLSASQILHALASSGAVAAVGFVESIVAAKVYASRHNYSVSANRELVALGVSNIVGSFFQSFPTFASISRTAVADSTGATSQVYAIITSCIVMMTILFMGPLFTQLPKTVMSGIIIAAALGIVELETLHFVWRMRAWTDLAFALLTFLLTTVLGVDLGISISLGLSALMVIRHQALPHIAVLGVLPKSDPPADPLSKAAAAVAAATAATAGPVAVGGSPSESPSSSRNSSISNYSSIGVAGGAAQQASTADVRAPLIEAGIPRSEEEMAQQAIKLAARYVLQGRRSMGAHGLRFADISVNPHATALPGVFIIRIEESLTFSNMEQIKQLFLRIETIGDHIQHPTTVTLGLQPAEAVVLDCRNIPSIDICALQTFEGMVQSYKSRGIAVVFVKIRFSLRRKLLRAGVLAPSDVVFGKLSTAVFYIEGQRQQRLATRSTLEAVSQAAWPSQPPSYDEHLSSSMSHPVRSQQQEQEQQQAPKLVFRLLGGTDSANADRTQRSGNGDSSSEDTPHPDSSSSDEEAAQLAVNDSSEASEDGAGSDMDNGDGSRSGRGHRKQRRRRAPGL